VNRSFFWVSSPVSSPRGAATAANAAAAVPLRPKDLDGRPLLVEKVIEKLLLRTLMAPFAESSARIVAILT